MIRAATEGDRDRLYELVGQLGHALPLDRAAFDATLDEYLAGGHPEVLLLLAEDAAGVVVGYVLSTITPLLGTNGPAAQLQEIVVDSDARGGDWGTQLVRAVEDECQRRGVRQLTVAARGAGGFYDRLGYHENAAYMRRFFD